MANEIVANERRTNGVKNINGLYQQIWNATGAINETGPAYWGKMKQKFYHLNTCRIMAW